MSDGESFNIIQVMVQKDLGRMIREGKEHINILTHTCTSVLDSNEVFKRLSLMVFNFDIVLRFLLDIFIPVLYLDKK